VSIKEFLSIKRILLCVGSGGVGKTTTAAAIAVNIAKSGKRVVVCTIDPARRLATSLGLDSLDNEAALVQEYGEGQLWALMLDVKRTFDELVGRYARNDEARERILGNHYYQHVSGALSVTHEFMAMEKLYELYESGLYDLIILDTPPTNNTIDFLKTPRLVMAAMDQRLVKWIVKPYLNMTQKSGGGWLQFGAEKVFTALSGIFGLDALKDLSEFVYIMEGLVEGFHERAEAIGSLIADVQTGFIVVSAARRQSIDEALYFYRELEGMDADVIAIILNRLRWPDGRPDGAELEELLGGLPEELRAPASADLERIVAEGQEEERLRGRLCAEIPEGIVQAIPEFSQDIHDLAGLEGYAEILQ